MGITELADNFGPSTKALYAKNPLHRQDGVTDRKFAILQGALWCKGYNPGYYLKEDPDTGKVSFEEIFNARVEEAVISLKTDAGFINPDGVVTPNVMKALLSMDSFKLLSAYYGGTYEVRSMQRNLTVHMRIIIRRAYTVRRSIRQKHKQGLGICVTGRGGYACRYGNR